MLMSYLHSLHYYSKTDLIKYLTFCTKLKNQIKTSPNTFDIPMTPRCYRMHESHIQAHELRVSGELEFDSPCTYKQLSEIRPAWYRIYFHSWHLSWILILLSIRTNLRAEIINQELHAHVFQ